MGSAAGAAGPNTPDKCPDAPNRGHLQGLPDTVLGAPVEMLLALATHGYGMRQCAAGL
jgi:hypothetical protein